jgi:hypothetical protein
MNQNDWILLQAQGALLNYQRSRCTQIVAEIKAAVNRWGFLYNKFYVGISAYPYTRLSEGHAVVFGRDLWRIWDCGTEVVARAVEKSLLALGFDGGTGGGDQDSKYVYVYLKRIHTSP